LTDMYLCYIDESGTPDLPGNTSHFILAGLAIPIEKWKECDLQVERIRAGYGIGDDEVHIAWLLRPYLEQTRIPRSDALSRSERKDRVEMLRKAELLRLQRISHSKQYGQTKKNYRETEKYMHLSYAERRQLAADLAECIASWSFAHLFAECVDKVFFNPAITGKTLSEQSFEQIVSRFERFLKNTKKATDRDQFGMLIHDNNDTIARKHTDLMKKYHRSGTLWIDVENIIETPLFVNSQLTAMVQVADLCAYSLRRYCENKEEFLFNEIFKTADRKNNTVVGVRHFTQQPCECRICLAHKAPVD
jgi:hypothetical protein